MCLQAIFSGKRLRIPLKTLGSTFAKPNTMKLYTCGNCRQPLYFENTRCLHCEHRIGFDPDRLTLITLVSTNGINFCDITNSQAVFRFCQNAAHDTCNWLIAEASNTTFCSACALNRTIPSLTDPENAARWSRIEVAKHRLIYSLLRLNLPIRRKNNQGENELVFDFLTEESPDKKVITGHNHGIITLNTGEADEAERIRNKVDLGEKYRTLLGHFRHEIGHYYWEVLIRDGIHLEKFRQLFGDENLDYSNALKMYYENGPSPLWANHFISPYASAHPWEDWAESWAHYLHMMDTLETAYSFGIGIHPEKFKNVEEMDVVVSDDPYTLEDFDTIVKMWYPLTFAVNSLNRSMGHADFYPFVISGDVVKKLTFIHEVCRANYLHD
jgi:hypothetical protein